MITTVKFKVIDREHSKAIQQVLFDLGYGWGSGGRKEYQFLYALHLYTDHSDMTITYSIDDGTYFEQHSNLEAKLIHPDQLKLLSRIVHPVNLIRDILETKFYLVNDIVYLNKVRELKLKKEYERSISI
jgi:hypothetical protein